MKRTLTPEQEDAARERRNTFRALAGKIGRMTADERGALAASLPVIATVEGRTLSVFNQCLVASQCPTATLVGGFQQWIKAGRAVRKGEHGLAIWIPTMRQGKDEVSGEDETAETHFIMGTVFDVSQTGEIAERVAA